MHTTRVLFLLVGATLAASCGSDTTEPTVGASGSLSFSYTGAGAANATQYSATGAIPVNVAINNGSSAWAAGAISGSSNEADVIASSPRTSSTWDMTFITIDRKTIGASTISTSCTANICSSVTVWFGATQNETNYTYFCEIASGTINISAITSSNITGTFSGTGTCHAASGGDTPFAVTGGTFNVGVTTQL